MNQQMFKEKVQDNVDNVNKPPSTWHRDNVYLDEPRIEDMRRDEYEKKCI